MIISIVFLLGLIWGSFFNVCIFRLPNKEDIIWKASRCLHCNKKIPWKLNIPVLSYLYLKGHCAFCSKKISLQYPIVELVSGFLFVVIFHFYGLSFSFLAYTLFLSSLLVASVIDLRLRIIPDEISLGGIVVGFLLSLLKFTHINWQQSLIGLLLGGVIFFIVSFVYEKLTKREGLGGGDIKLLAMIGAWLGPTSILPVILISSALGSVVGLSFMILKKKNLQTAIPFGPFLSFSAMIYLFFQPYFDLHLYGRPF